ncbi:unnamed protein product [Caenorhabditis brenneri]
MRRNKDSFITSRRRFDCNKSSEGSTQAINKVVKQPSSTEVELAKQGHVNPEVAKHSTSCTSHHHQSSEDRSNLDKPSESNERIRRKTTTIHEAANLHKSHKDLSRDEDNISQLVLRNGAEATVINTCKDSMQTTKSSEEFRKPLGIQLDMRIHRQRSLAEEQVTSQGRQQKPIKIKDEDNLEEFISKKGPSSQHLSGVNQDEVDQRINEDHVSGPVKPERHQ